MELYNIDGKKKKIEEYQDFRSRMVIERMNRFQHYQHSKSGTAFYNLDLRRNSGKEVLRSISKEGLRAGNSESGFRHRSNQHRNTYHINQKDLSPKKCLLNNNIDNMKTQLISDKQDGFSLKNQFIRNIKLIYSSSHKNYKHQFKNDMDKQKAFDSKLEFQKLLKKTQQIQKVIEITKNQSAQLMDYNEKKLEEIKKKEEEIIDLKKQDAKFDGCFRLEYADILRKKKENKKLQDKDNYLSRQMHTLQQIYLRAEYERDMYAAKILDR